MKESSAARREKLHRKNSWISFVGPRRNESEAIERVLDPIVFTNAILHSGSRTDLPSRRGILRIQGNENNGFVSRLDSDNRRVFVADDSKRIGIDTDAFVAN